MIVSIKATVKPTEDIDKAKLAILNIFPDAELEVAASEVRGIARSIDKLAELLERQRIRDAARAVLLGAQSGNELRLSLNKQVAFRGKVNFDCNAPLGSIEVVVGDTDIEELVERIAPRTAETE